MCDGYYNFNFKFGNLNSNVSFFGRSQQFFQDEQYPSIYANSRGCCNEYNNDCQENDMMNKYIDDLSDNEPSFDSFVNKYCTKNETPNENNTVNDKTVKAKNTPNENSAVKDSTVKENKTVQVDNAAKDNAVKENKTVKADNAVQESTIKENNTVTVKQNKTHPAFVTVKKWRKGDQGDNCMWNIVENNYGLKSTADIKKKVAEIVQYHNEYVKQHGGTPIKNDDLIYPNQKIYLP